MQCKLMRKILAESAYSRLGDRREYSRVGGGRVSSGRPRYPTHLLEGIDDRTATVAAISSPESPDSAHRPSSAAARTGLDQTG